MELENYENYEDNFVNPEEYLNKLNNLRGGLSTLLEEYKKIYVTAKMNPNNQAYRYQFENVNMSLNEVVSNTFSVSNNVEMETNNLNKKLFEINGLIQNEKEKNRELKAKLGIVEDQNNASSEMINDYKDIYDKKYLRNWGLILSGVICFAAISTIYRKPLIPVNKV